MLQNTVSTRRNIGGTEFPILAAALPVVANDPVGDTYWHIRLKAATTHLSSRPGQFFQLRCPRSEAGDPFLRRPMSVYAVDTNVGEIAFLYKVTGIGTTGLSTLVPGDTLDVLGPLGVGFDINPEWDHVLVVARGVGLATMGPLARALHHNGVALTAICSYRTPEATIGLEPFELHGSVHTVYDTDGTSDIASVDSLIREEHARRSFSFAYTCGSKRIVSLLQDLSSQLGFGGEVALEQRMACGLGMCHSCVIDLRRGDTVESVRVCTRGPVFSLGDIVAPEETLSWYRSCDESAI
ncbi:Dihydroorotate dehydrogenase electron transfer subunit [hydrothermal vent metagenome]|uniref:Dihydroorotate dehydrogenase electron transfer subunit n=1 Tax=hydrothermal vent metagenome TaxID=652676 RepID=A0A3B0SLD0_9ZZZZ